VAAGKGTRLGGDRPKQFLQLAGVPVIIHTLKQFERSKRINEVIMVLPAEDTAGFESLAQKFELSKCAASWRRRHARKSCGTDWQRSRKQRSSRSRRRAPVRDAEEIDEVVGAAETGAAILTAPVADTIKRVDERSHRANDLAR
jgi:2-C-methyl-D-erythritol 4-phosphate cytidylyltransferase